MLFVTLTLVVRNGHRDRLRCRQTARGIRARQLHRVHATVLVLSAAIGPQAHAHRPRHLPIPRVGPVRAGDLGDVAGNAAGIRRDHR